jgi:hypothetical protein
LDLGAVFDAALHRAAAAFAVARRGVSDAGVDAGNWISEHRVAATVGSAVVLGTAVCVVVEPCGLIGIAGATEEASLECSLAAEEGSDVEATTQILQSHVDAARTAYDSGEIGMSPEQARAAADNPGLAQAFRGSVIDNAAKESIANDPLLSNVYVTPRFTWGADFFDGEGNWWDMTTEGKWASHVRRYGDYFGGQGIRLPTDG